MACAPTNRTLDWSRREWFGNPNNQCPVAAYDDGKMHCRITIQTFTCPRFFHDPHFGQCYVSFSVWLWGRTSSQSRSFFLAWDSDTELVRKRAEAAYTAVVFYANKATNKRPKEVIGWLESKINAAVAEKG